MTDQELLDQVLSALKGKVKSAVAAAAKKVGGYGMLIAIGVGVAYFLPRVL